MCTKASPSSPTGMGQFLKALRLLQVGRRLTFEYIARLVEIDVHLNTLHLHECKIFHSPFSNYRTAHISCRVPENRLSDGILRFLFKFVSFLFFVLSFCFLFFLICLFFFSFPLGKRKDDKCSFRDGTLCRLPQTSFVRHTLH